MKELDIQTFIPDLLAKANNDQEEPTNFKNYFVWYCLMQYSE